MRHSRRAVMTEHYKLYLKKNVFNGRYFVRNVQIGICTAAVGVLIAGAAGVVTMGHKTGATEAKNSVKEALFGVEATESTEAVQVAENIVVKETAAPFDAAELVTEEKKETEQAAVSTEQETLAQAATEQKSEFDGKCIANVEETLNIRKEPSTDAEFVGSMSNGAIARIMGTDGEWTKIKSGDVEGYVLTDYILTGEDAEELAEEHVTLVGTVLEDGVNVRMEQSTDADILTVLNKDDTISVLGSSAKENTQNEDSQDGQPSDEAPAAADSTEETGTEENSTEQAAEASGETVTEETEQETEESSETVTDQTETTETEKTAETESEKLSEEMPEETASSEQFSSITESVEEMTQEEERQETKAEEESEAQAETQASTQDITWIPVMLEDGQVGYVSAELVNVDRLYELAVSAEELERKAREEEEARRAAEEEAWRQAQAEAAAAANSYDNSYSGSDSPSSDYSSSSSSYSGETVTPVTASASGECLGTFTLTAYCGCSKCSGGHNLTATGTTPAEGRTIAADPSVLPYGTQVVIDGVVYTVEDCGSGVCGNHIDIFCATHDSALAFGRRTAKVYKY